MQRSIMIVILPDYVDYFETQRLQNLNVESWELAKNVLYCLYLRKMVSQRSVVQTKLFDKITYLKYF